MQIFKRLATTSAILALSGTFFLTPAFALDASKVIKRDTKSSTIFQLFFGFIEEGKTDDAFDVLKYAADQGNSAAQWKLAKMYERGEQGVEKDPLEAFKMFHKVAAKYTLARPNTPSWQFSADALVALGNYYRKGIPNTIVRADPATATTMYTTAAMIFRHPGAQFELGRMQITNDGVFGQGRLGVRNLQLAEQKGHVGAEALLGFAHFEGVHVKQDVVRGMVMLGHARHRANADDYEWISQLHDEAFALAKPNDRAEATRKLQQKLGQ
ncbi:MAG: tetratricopeptide repeat protein [Rhizobiaceae bacterium]|nr:tetratricopeptide repeat protein [Rhizobiaceae bacterium]